MPLSDNCHVAGCSVSINLNQCHLYVDPSSPFHLPEMGTFHGDFPLTDRLMLVHTGHMFACASIRPTEKTNVLHNIKIVFTHGSYNMRK